MENSMPVPTIMSVTEVLEQQQIRLQIASRRFALVMIIATSVAVLVAVVVTVVHAQDKYSLKSPSGIAFADFQGYEDWSVVSSARTDQVLKVIVANPTMIKAYKAGIPGKRAAFP